MGQPPWRRRPFRRVFDALSKRGREGKKPPAEPAPQTLPAPTVDVEKRKAELRAALAGAGTAAPAGPPAKDGWTPLRKGLLVALAMLLVTANLLMVFRGWEPTRWLPISMDLGAEDPRRFEAWERRGSALSYLTAEGREVADPASASAVSGRERVPLEAFKAPPLPEGGGLGGILTPEELKGLRRKSGIAGLDLARFLSESPPATGAILLKKTEKDRFTPYRHTDSPRAARQAPQAGVSLGRAGENLENYAEPTTKVKAEEGFLGAAGAGKYQKVPEGLSGPELIMAMLDDEVMDSFKRYAKEGKWRMKKVSGLKQEVPELDGNALLTSEALAQLLETKRATDKAMKCEECRVEDKIHNNRATFYGEKYEK